MVLTVRTILHDAKCGKSGIREGYKCTKQTANSTIAPRANNRTSAPEGGNNTVRNLAIAIGLTGAAYIAARERYRSAVRSSAVDAVRRSKTVDGSTTARQERIVFLVPGVSGSESAQQGNSIDMAWKKGLSFAKNPKKDEKLVRVDTRKANIPARDADSADAKEIMELHLKNQIKGRNEAAVDMAASLIAFRKANLDKPIVIVGHSYGGAIAREALAIMSQTKTNMKNITSIGLGTNDYSLLSGMINKDVKEITLGGPKDPFTSSGPTSNLRNIETLQGHSLRDYSSNAEVKKFFQMELTEKYPISRRDDSLTKARLDKKCGASGIPEGAKCSKNTVQVAGVEAAGVKKNGPTPDYFRGTLGAIASGAYTLKAAAGIEFYLQNRENTAGLTMAAGSLTGALLAGAGSKEYFKGNQVKGALYSLGSSAADLVGTAAAEEQNFGYVKQKGQQRPKYKGDPFKDLGVDENSSMEDIRKAYMKLVKTNHPDMGGDTAKMQKINEAWTEVQKRKGRKDSPLHILYK